MIATLWYQHLGLAARRRSALSESQNNVSNGQLARVLAAAALAASTLFAVLGARADESIATLWLDSDSYISYSASEKAKLPDGSSIGFHLGRPAGDGSIPITIYPADLRIAPIPIAQGAAVEYALAEPAVGTLRPGPAGGEIDLSAVLVATLRGRPEVPPVAHPLRFTTSRAQAESTDGTRTIAVDGAPATPTNAVRLVAATTNPADAFPGPGQAVHAVLSGRFDWLPPAP